MAEPAVQPLPEGLAAALAQPEAYPEDPDAAAGLRHVQTHISHVYLSAARVYKLRKALAPGFLDFSSAAQRAQDCLRELALNRRLAPDVYLGVAPIWLEGGRARVGAPGEQLCAGAAEHCVVMRRLPEGADALSLLERGELTADQLERVAQALARFHAGVRLAAAQPAAQRLELERAAGPVLANFEVLAREPRVVPLAEVEALRAQARAAGEARRALFTARAREGRRVDGHGDLHLQHIWFERPAGPPLFVDCIEFSDALRQIDVACELAFLAMDLRAHGRSDLGEFALRRYAALTDDFGLYGVLDYYMSYRAAVRAKVNALAAAQEALPDAERAAAAARARSYLALARELLEPRPRPPLVLLCGVVGSGKSSAAQLVADELGGAVIRSDELRKRLAGWADTARGGAAAGLYDPGWTERVYGGLRERAEPVLDSGRAVVLDASFSRREQRTAAALFARVRRYPIWIAQTLCAPAEALERLARREREGADPSDAGPDFYARSAAEFEPVQPGEADRHFAVHTDAPDWRAALREALRAR